MNLLEFLENWDDNTQVLVEKIQKKYLWKIADMSKNVACRYWIQKAGVKYYNEIMHIAVENMKVK